MIEPVQTRDEPARQQATGTAKDEGGILAALLQVAADAAQTLEGVAGGIAQALAGIGEFYAATVLAEQGDAQLFLQHPYLAAHRAVGNVQLFRGTADALQPGGSFEGTQGIQRGKVSAHDDM
ncbi:hypothetical protein FQZ97_1077540 [compost metagenome]